ncbi:MAG: FecR domain-containing protein [Prevotella sp.]|nr:FecR domain-containing protein [Prevotella sp.]
MNQGINALIKKLLLGEATEEEKAAIRETVDKQSFREIMQAQDFVERYQLYADIDEKRAYAEMLERIENEKSEVEGEQKQGFSQILIPESSTPTRSLSPLTSNLLKYAAAILVFVIASAGYWYSQYTKVTPPEISEEIQLAMQQSIQSGKQEALSEELRVKSEESELSEELRVKSEDGLLSEGEKYIGNDKRRTNSEESPTKNFSHPFNNSSSLFTLNSSLNITSSLTKDQLLAAKRITTRHDKEFWLTLDDGTLVHINYNTRLIYPERFGRGDRNVILDGEAYFMVAKDKSRPFIVHTPNGDVKVYGTEFNVNTRTEVRGKKIRGERSASGAENTSLSTAVVLVKGSVSVTPTGSKEIMLKPNQQATVNGQSSMVNIENVDVSSYVAWNEGKFLFEDCPLWKLMEVLGRWYNVNVRFKSDELKQLRFMGSLNRYNDIIPVLSAIEKSTEVNVKLHDNEVVIGK